MGKSDLEILGTGAPTERRPWLRFLLILSLSLNLATMGALVYWRWQAVNEAGRRQAGPPLTVKELCISLPMRVEQCRQFRSKFLEHQKRRQDIRMKLGQEQRRLWELMKQDAPSWPEIQGKIKEISLLQTRMEEEAVQLCLEFQKHLQPGQRAVYLKVLEQQLHFGVQMRRGTSWSKNGEEK